jgi:REP element-mobilizing transposase RayT
MPCYLFTYHAHGSWLPDHERGYVKRGRGVLPTDHRMAAIYGENLKRRVAVFDDAVQRRLIEALLEACACQDCTAHYIATEPTHVHVLVSWKSDRKWEIVRKQLRYNASVRLNDTFGKREWFAKSPSRRQVKDNGHFRYLMTKYLPRHRGLKWCAERVIFS